MKGNNGMSFWEQRIIRNNLYFSLNECILVDMTFFSFGNVAFKNPFFPLTHLSSDILAMVRASHFPLLWLFSSPNRHIDCLVLVSNLNSINLSITSFQLQCTKVIYILIAFLTYSLYKITREFNYLCFTVILLCKNSTLVNITINTKWSKCFQQLTHIVVFWVNAIYCSGGQRLKCLLQGSFRRTQSFF